MDRRLIVIGGQAAGLSAAARAKRIDPRLEVIVFEKSSRIAFAPCGLPYWLEGEVPGVDKLSRFTPEEFERERRVRVCTGVAVVAIQHSRRQVVLSTGERVGYDALVIATGARARKDLPGAEQPHVFTLQTLEGAEALSRFVKDRKPERATVIGAGYLGLELVEVLLRWGLKVRLFEATGGFLGRSEPGMVQWVREYLERLGVEVHLNEPVREIGARQVNGYPSDLVVLATGFQPNVALAEEAGVRLGRTGAIQVNEHMETNLPGVFAAGDCVEVRHIITGTPVYLPLGTTANKTGRVAGACAAGRRERFEGVAGTAIVRVGSLAIAATGVSNLEARAAGFDPVTVEIQARDKPDYMGSRPLYVSLTGARSSGRLLGGVIVGEFGVAGRINVLATALQARMTVDELYQVDLAYAPPFAPVWDPLLVAARELAKQL